MKRRPVCPLAVSPDGFIAGPILLFALLAGCTSGDPAAAAKSGGAAALAAATVDTGGVERPLWQFGESSLRTDTLPAEMDSLRDWGEYSDAERPIAYAIDVNRDGKMTGSCAPRRDSADRSADARSGC